jgi:acid phosphatase type 7
MSRLRILLVFACLLLSCGSAHAARCIRGPYLQDAAVGALTIRWELDRLGPSSLEYAAPGQSPRTVDCEFKGRKHRVRLIGLRPGETYHYRIRYRDERASDEYSFRAVPEGAVAMKFAVFGDFGAGTKEQFQVARLLEKSDAELALLTGDLIYGRGEEEHYDLRFFEPYRRSLRRMTFWPALGNHDVGSKDGAAALAAFDVPLNGPTSLQGGRNYSFDYGNAHFAAIDSNASAVTLQKVIGPWLLADMQRSTARWKFVFFHHPPFSSANHGENAKIRDLMVPIFARAGIDIVFAGHDHSYERIKPQDGVTYIVSGNGGNKLYEHKNPHPYTERFYNEKHGLTLVTIDGGKLLLRHVNVDGDEVDRLELSK